MSKHSESQIVQIEERLRQAMLNSDVAELDALIAPELLFTSYFGQVFSKQEDLALHQSGKLKFRELTPGDRHIQLNEGFSVVSVQMHVVSRYEGEEMEMNVRFTRVWSVSSAGSLQVVAGHVSVVQPSP
jgi:ketosteroid isomerase-like protein